MLKTLGERFAIDETAFKPYPSCRYSHAALDLLCEIVAQEKIAAADVSAVRIGLPRAGMALIGIPEDAKRKPRSIVDGQFSMHFLAAVALTHGRMTWDDYTLLGDPQIARTIERIDVQIDPEIEARFPTMAASVEVVAGDRKIRRVNWTPKGEPDKPLGWNGVTAKFMSLAQAAYDNDRCVRIVQMVRSLELLDGIGELTTLLGR